MRAAFACLVTSAALLTACSPKAPAETPDQATPTAAAAAPTPRPLTPGSDPAPSRKPGLWEMSVSGGDGEARSSQLCLDAATDQLAGLGGGRGMGRGGGGGACPQTIKKTADGYTIDSVCARGERTVTSHAVVTGDVSSRYTVQSSTTMDPPREGAPAERKSTITAHWVGPCPADQKPGDMTMGDGTRFNIAQPRPWRGNRGGGEGPGGGEGQGGGDR